MSGDKDIFILHLQEGPFHFRDLFLASRETESLLPWLFLSTYLFINLFLAVPGPQRCSQAFSSCACRGGWAPTAASCPVAECRL